jgi:hypothetical protein
VTDMEDVCRVCGQTRRWHMEHKPHHEFSIVSAVPTLPKAEAVPTLRGDIVLRLTLMRKGLVSEVELEETRRLVERAAEFGRAVVLEPDPEGITGWKFNLVTQEELIQRVVSEGGSYGQAQGEAQEQAPEQPVRVAQATQVPHA